MKQPTIEELFSDIYRLRIIKFFIRNPDDFFDGKNVARRMDIRKNIFARETKKLLGVGFLRTKKVGGFRAFSLNKNFYLADEISNLIKKSVSVSDEDLMSMLKKLGQLKLVAISGVFIGNDESRADIIIVGKVKPARLDKFVKAVEVKVGKELVFALMTPEEFKYRYQMFDRFVRDFLDASHKMIIKKLKF